MVQDRKHKALLTFIRKVLDVPLGYSKDDLLMFRSVASKDYRSLLPLIDDYLQLAERADTNASPKGLQGRATKRSSDLEQMHLFDMLREKRLFPSNSELSDFAGRVLPNMSRHRFDKMSRGDIATRIIEYLETRDRRTRDELEASMREAMTVCAPLA